MSVEDRLEQVTVGELRPLTGKIALADYDPAWPVRYAEAKSAVIADILG